MHLTQPKVEGHIVLAKPTAEHLEVTTADLTISRRINLTRIKLATSTVKMTEICEMLCHCIG